MITWRAALIHQHATGEQDQEIAKALSRRARAARKKAKKQAKKKTDGDPDQTA